VRPTRAERRHRVGLAARLTILLGVVAGLGVLVMGIYVSRALEAQAVGRLQETLVTHAALLRDAFAPLIDGFPGDAGLQAPAQRYGRILGARVTVIGADGTVLAESDRESVREMENHAGRPEVRQALAGSVGRDVRRSATLGRDLLYVAVPLEREGGRRAVLRLALPTHDVDEARALVRRTVVGGALLAVGVALVIGLFVSRRVTRPLRGMEAAARRMAEGDLAQGVPVAGSDEIAALGVALNRTAVALREKIERLGDEQAKVRTILDGMTEGVIALDDRGRLLLLNPAARMMFGVESEAPEGRSFLEVIRQKGLFDLVEEVRSSSAPVRHELELGFPVNRVVAVRGAPLGLGGEAAGVLLVLHDVTELRRLERVRSEFVANVSHELRTPLTCIKGYLETLLDGALDDRAHARRFLEVAGIHAERLDRLIDDLLELSNIESGRVKLVPMQLDLGDVVTGVAAMFEGRTAQNHQVLERAVPPGLAVRADRDRLVQILVNLVDNAVKFTPEGGQVRIEAGPGPAGRVEIRVRDTGIGIPSTDLPRITERFYRVDKTRSQEAGGTGLGLAIVKHLVQAHGSELRIESALGHGTTVSFTLPRGEGAVAP
jgi:two-component system, OmpR family, phosphate regulon sensor histidine kinase PhoR